MFSQTIPTLSDPEMTSTLDEIKRLRLKLQTSNFQKKISGDHSELLKSMNEDKQQENDTILNDFIVNHDQINQICTRLQELIKYDIYGIKTDISGIKTDISGIKTDIRGKKTDFWGMKAEISEMKAEISRMKTDISEMKTGFSDLRNHFLNLLQNLNQGEENH